MKPLAYRIRPNNFQDIIGQDHLTGENGIITKMAKNNTFYSLILYGPPGCGKTSIASIIATYFPLNNYFFNASVDNKAKLKDIADATKYYPNVLVVIDEIHRMKKDIQDFLLPYLESGSLIVIGLTTENPYSSINPAIRSRCHIYRMNAISKPDIIKLLQNVLKSEDIFKDKTIPLEVLDYIATASSCEVRASLNMLEAISLIDGEITISKAEQLIGKKVIPLDQNGENYYDILSALIKSIRGSDPDAGLHYLARLLAIGDLEIISRRLMLLCYEDIGLANTQIGPRIKAATETAIMVGMPEARIPLGYAVVDMALSPKSNSTYLAIDKAISDLDKMSDFSIPKHILNKELKSGKYNYLYPHDYPDDFVVQDYMPESIKDHTYYLPKETGAYEKALKQRLDELNRRKKLKK